MPSPVWEQFSHLLHLVATFQGTQACSAVTVPYPLVPRSLPLWLVLSPPGKPDKRRLMTVQDFFRHAEDESELPPPPLSPHFRLITGPFPLLEVMW